MKNLLLLAFAFASLSAFAEISQTDAFPNQRDFGPTPGWARGGGFDHGRPGGPGRPGGDWGHGGGGWDHGGGWGHRPPPFPPRPPFPPPPPPPPQYNDLCSGLFVGTLSNNFSTSFNMNL